MRPLYLCHVLCMHVQCQINETMLINLTADLSGSQYSSHFPQRVDGAHGLPAQVNEGAVAELSKVSKATCIEYLCR